MLEPLIPETAKAVRRTLNLSLLEALKGVPKGLKVERPQPLFRKVSRGEIGEKLKGEGEMGEVTPEDVAKLGLKVAKVIGVEEVPKAKKLYKLKLDLGGGVIKQTVAGLKEYYKSEELLGKLVVVVSNMKPTRLMGLESEVMLLAAVEEGKVSIIVPEKPIKLGSEIY
jgi:methionyl-tRNA synthetase